MPSTGTSPQSSGRHWIKYVRWDVIQGWRRHAMRSSAGQLAYPFAYGSTERAMPDIEGGVLWLISAPRYGRYRMPPSLIARLDVRAVVRPDSPAARSVDTAVLKHARREHDRQQGWVALAQRDTRAYLPLNNALHTLQQLSFLGRVERLPEPGAARPGPGGGIYSRIPTHFQQHRVVHPRSVHTLEDYAAAVRAGRRAFISYRWDDFDEDSGWLPALSGALEAGQVSCWWDRWHVPKQDKPIETRLLADILSDAVRQSSWFIALMRPDYLSPPESEQATWARREWDMAGTEATSHGRRNPMHRVAVVFGDRTRTSVSDWLRARDTVLPVPDDAAPHLVAGRLLALFPPVAEPEHHPDSGAGRATGDA